jgi:hypothetical protein
MAKPTSKKSSALSAGDRAAQEAAKHAPVSLPSGGSFDREALQKGLERAAAVHPDKRDAEVGKAIENARTDAAHTRGAAAGAIPGHKFVDAEVQIAPGSEVGTGKNKETVGAVVVTEKRQVFDPASAEEGTLVSGGQPVSGSSSEVLSVEESEPLADAPSVPAEDAESGEPGTTTEIPAGDGE